MAIPFSAVHASNSKIASTLPPKLVAVFVGATQGVGATTMREFARYSTRPRIYFTGRSETKGAALLKELQEEINPDGEYVFLPGDMSLLKTVDETCRTIKAKEESINVLFLSQGTFNMDENAEGIPFAYATVFHARLRFAANLLPLLRKARHIRRVVSVTAAGKEGKLYVASKNSPQDQAEPEWDLRKVPLTKFLPHAMTMLSLGMLALSSRAPEVSCSSWFPGMVDTGMIRGDEGWAIRVFSWFTRVKIWLFGSVPIAECGERGIFIATSGRFPSAESGEDKEGDGVPLEKGKVDVAMDLLGKVGGGGYAVGEHSEGLYKTIGKVIGGYARDGTVEKMWKYFESEFVRITGTVSI